MYFNYFLIVIYTFLSSLAALLWKKAASRNDSIKQLIFEESFLYIGGICYLASSIGSIIALKYLPYSTVYFFSALTYVWSIILAKTYLKEKISFSQIIATMLILSGVFLIT